MDPVVCMGLISLWDLSLAAEAAPATIIVTLLRVTRVVSLSYIHDFSLADVAIQICSTTNQNSSGYALFRCRIEVKWMPLAARFALFEHSRSLIDGMLIYCRPVRFLELLLSLSNLLLQHLVFLFQHHNFLLHLRYNFLCEPV
jgi:hypothetical protein